MHVRIPIIEQYLCSVFKIRTIFMFNLLNSNKRNVRTLIRNQNMFEFNEIFSEISIILNVAIIFMCMLCA